jgi:hypothetical protein
MPLSCLKLRRLSRGIRIPHFDQSVSMNRSPEAADVSPRKLAGFAPATALSIVREPTDLGDY